MNECRVPVVAVWRRPPGVIAVGSTSSQLALFPLGGRECRSVDSCRKGPRHQRGSVLNPMRLFGSVLPSLGLAAGGTLCAGRGFQRVVQGNTQGQLSIRGAGLCVNGVFLNNADDASRLRGVSNTHVGYRKGVTYPRIVRGVDEARTMGTAPRDRDQSRSIQGLYAPASRRIVPHLHRAWQPVYRYVPRPRVRPVRRTHHSRSRQVLPDDGQKGTRHGPSSRISLPWAPSGYPCRAPVGNGQSSAGA